MDEFLDRRRKKKNDGNNEENGLTVIFTTRSTSKGNDTLARLIANLQHSHPSSSSRIRFISENVDLTNLISVRALSQRLVRRIPKLDAIILNAGLGGWNGIDWVGAVWGVCTDLVHQVSWPTYKLAAVGEITPRQIPWKKAKHQEQQQQEEEEPRLGSVFCANVFGHYMLTHNLVSLLKRGGQGGGEGGGGRIIWISSLEATTNLFDVDDIQGLRSKTPYESSKALTDILALTSNLPCTAPWVKSFYNNDNNDNNKPMHMYLAHPGICATSIVPLALPMFYSMLCIFTIARLLGSPWHTISTYLGAVAPVWLSLSDQQDLDRAELPYRENGGGGRAKWGSSSSLAYGEQPASTEVDGWGFGGVVGPAVVDEDRRRRRKRGAVDLSAVDRERFELLGRLCWQRMEALRLMWDGLLDEAVPFEQ